MQNPHIRILDMVETIDAVAEILIGIDFDSYSADYKTRRAIERCVEIVSEATRHLSPDLKAEFQNILGQNTPWKEVTSIGNLLRHEYYRVDDFLMWKIATQSLPDLRPVRVQLASRLPPLFDSEHT